MSNVMGGRAAATVVAGLVLALSGTARAAEVNGTPGNDRIHGTRQAGVSDAQAGEDRVGAGRGPDTVTGGEGADRIWGRWGADRLFGGVGDHRVGGGAGDHQAAGE